MALMKVVKKNLKEEAKQSVRVTTKKAREPEVVIKEGTPLDQSVKKNVNDSRPVKLVGMSKGITKNMGDYESLRVDCWMSDEPLEGETTQQALDRLSKVINDQVELEVINIMGD